MANESLESIEPIVGETRDITKIYLETLTQAVETETKKLREQAEQDSNQIIAEARDEANRIIAEARQKAEEESKNILAQAEEQTGQILKNAHEKASVEAQKESVRIITETKERMAQIIREVIDCDIKPEQNDPTEDIETEQKIGEESKVKTEDKAESVSEADMKMQEGIDLLKSGKNEEALEVFNKVLALDPQNTLALSKKSTALGNLGRHMEALKILRENL
jgi:F0F1-type ATP synthase membrane subunit b/b'